MSEELRLLYRPRGADKWLPLGEDGNGFDRSSDGVRAAWSEAQKAANLGLPWAGAVFRLVDPFEGDHADDCVLGLDLDAWCDCGVELVVVEECVVMPEGPAAFEVRTRVLGPGEAGALGLGGLVVEGTIEPQGVFGEVAPDGKALVELSRLSPLKVAEPWTGRPAQMQILANTLYGRQIPRGKRADIKERMEGRPLSALPVVVAEVLGEE